MHTSRQGRTLQFSPRALVEQFGSPLYVYEESRMVARATSFLGIPYQPLSIFFASMSNNNPEVLRLLARCGVRLFVNTPKHLLLGRSIGFASSDIVFTGTNLSSDDLRHVIRSGAILNIDSLGQLDLYGQLCPFSKVGLRINILTVARYHDGPVGPYFGPKSRIGIAEHELPEAFAIARRHGLALNGLHVYLGTNILDSELFLEGADEALRVARTFPALEYVDLGGGFGVSYHAGQSELDLKVLGPAMAQRMEVLSAEMGRRIELALEPGRAMLADAGYFLTTVTDVKHRPDRILAGVDSSVDIFPRPLYYDVSTEGYHEVFVDQDEDVPQADLPVDICGSTTYSRDYLARNRRLPLPHRGQVLVFCDAGAYSYSCITDFLGRLRPPEVLVERSGKVRLIREGEKLSELSVA